MKKVPIVIRMPEELANRVRNMAYWTELPLNEFFNEAVERLVSKIEAANTRRFDPRESNLRPGPRTTQKPLSDLLKEFGV